MEENTLMNVEAVLQDLARDIREGYIDTLTRNGRVASHKLVNSISTHVVRGLSNYLVTMSLESYWKYVEDDTRPHWPPRSAILKWIEVKPVIPRPGRDGRIPSPKSLAFLISRKIASVGTKGSHDLLKTREAVVPMYYERLSQALAKDAETLIKERILPGEIQSPGE